MITKEKIDVSVTGLTNTYLNNLQKIEGKITKNDFILKINDITFPASELNKIHLDLSSLTYTAKKKVGKRMSFFEKKGTIKSINNMFRFLYRLNVINDEVRITPSLLEQKIQLSRKLYVKLRDEAEVARLAYKELKGDFYKK